MTHLLTALALAGQTLGPDEIAARDVVDLPSLPDRPEFSPFIINGEDAAREDWPMTGGIVLRGMLDLGGTEIEQTALICTSTLIAPDVVMLAAHCVDPEPIRVQLGQMELNDVEFYWSTRPNLSEYQLGAPAGTLPADAGKATSWVMHPDWNIYLLQLGMAENHDIALIFLETPILDLPLGYLPQPDTDETQLAVDEEVVVVGWGQQTSTGQGQAPPAGTVGFKKMGTSHVERREAYEFQVGGIPSDVRKCHGDSGGPTFKQVVTDSTETWRVIGVTSHSYDSSDCSTTGGVDTRVSFYLDWIDATMRAACEDGTRSWCEIEGIIPPPLPDGTLAWLTPEDEGDGKGCGCDAGSGPFGVLGLLPALAFVRRRR